MKIKNQLRGQTKDIWITKEIDTIVTESGLRKFPKTFSTDKDVPGIRVHPLSAISGMFRSEETAFLYSSTEINV